jgi:hypothetical protein
VPNITIGPLVVEAIRPVTDKVLDCHLVSGGVPGARCCVTKAVIEYCNRLLQQVLWVIDKVLDCHLVSVCGGGADVQEAAISDCSKCDVM